MRIHDKTQDMHNPIDVSFNVYSDTPKGKDPDSFSPTLRKYHQVLWSKPLPNGYMFDLDDKRSNVLHHKSKLGEFVLSSDSIGRTFNKIKSMKGILNKIPSREVDSFFSLSSTIGGYIIFPSRRVENKMTINGARGLNRSIKDRFDLTLECIRCFYSNETSPLESTLKRYSSFFGLFQNFKGYVDFFLLQDLAITDCSQIKFCLPFDRFNRSPLPKDTDEYEIYKENMMDFIAARNIRIHKAVNEG